MCVQNSKMQSTKQSARAPDGGGVWLMVRLAERGEDILVPIGDLVHASVLMPGETVLARWEGRVHLATVRLISDDKYLLERKMKKAGSPRTPLTHKRESNSSMGRNVGCSLWELRDSYSSCDSDDTPLKRKKQRSKQKRDSRSSSEHNKKSDIISILKQQKTLERFSNIHQSPSLLQDLQSRNLPSTSHQRDIMNVVKRPISTVKPYWNNGSCHQSRNKNKSNRVMTFDQQSQTISTGENKERQILNKLLSTALVMSQEFQRMSYSLDDMQEQMENISDGVHRIQAELDRDMECNNPTESSPKLPLTPTKSSLGDVENEAAEEEQVIEENIEQPIVDGLLQNEENFPDIPVQLVAPSMNEDDSFDMIPIGPGRTLVSRHVYQSIDWNSHTGATRKLLMEMFPRKILATHSLTGKSSPAFTNKPAKLCLDPRKVADIVITVSQQCGVKESLVRNAITTKLADENKMHKLRLNKISKIKKLKYEVSEDSNEENIEPPDLVEDDGSNEPSTSNK